MLSSSVLAVSHHPEVRRLITTSSASRKLVGRFIAGDDLETAIAPVRALVGRGMLVTVDLSARTSGPGRRRRHPRGLCRAARPLDASAWRTRSRCRQVSALGQALPGDGDRIALEHAAAICAAAGRPGTTVTLDMEDHTTVDSILAILAEAARASTRRSAR